MNDLIEHNARNDPRPIRPFPLRTVLFILTMVVCGLLCTQNVPSPTPPNLRHVGPPDFLEREMRARMNAPIEVARVFDRVTGCTEAGPSLINLVAREAVSAGVHPNVLAATVAVESHCNPLAVSPRGALGLTQVVARLWDDQFDFSRVNLLNPSDNVRTGATIMAGLIRANGLRRGVQLYNGAGVGCRSCDSGYSERVLALAGIAPAEKPRVLVAETVQTGSLMQDAPK